MLHAVVSLVIEVAKRAGRGGTVTISARRSGNTVRFAVGTAVAGAATSQAPSFRVWLATALIEAQGGRVWSGQAVGRDKHIYFTMP